MKIKNLSLISEQTGEKVLVSEVDSNVLVAELLNAVIKKLPLPINARGVIIRKKTYKQLLPGQSLGSAAIEDNETLMVDFEKTAGGGVAVTSFRNIQIIDAYLHRKAITSNYPYAICSIILYSDIDKKIKRFFRNNFKDLHHMAGGRTLFFIVERPSSKWLPIMQEELKEKLGPYVQSIWDLLEEDQFHSLDSSVIYKVAETMNIKRSQIPCIVFFTNLYSKDLVVVPFDSLLEKPLSVSEDNDLVKMFRSIFDATETASHEPEEKRLGKLKDELNKLDLSKKNRNGVSSFFTEVVLKTTVSSIIESIIKLVIQ